MAGIRAKLRCCALHWRSHSFSSPALVPVVLAVLLLLCAAAFSRVVIFFLPLVASTSICCAAAYLLAAGERGAAEAVLVRGDGEEVGLLQVFDVAHASAYGGRRGGGDVRVRCLLHMPAGGGWTTKRGGGGRDDGEDVVVAGRLLVAGAGQDGQDRAALEEELAALQVDRLAEGVWDSYFSDCSRWSYVTAKSGEPEIEERLI